MALRWSTLNQDLHRAMISSKCALSTQVYSCVLMNPLLAAQQLTHSYDNNHIDLPDLNVPHDGYCPYSDQTWNHDGNGHGTHCAGIVGAIGGNGEGLTSLNPDPNKFDFFISKGLKDSGTGTLSGILSA
eukprot:11807902-Ditylum_brightwellii.AAC.1